MMTPEKIIQFTCKEFNIKTKDLLGKSRVQYLVDIRSVLVKRLLKWAGMSFASIGQILDRHFQVIMNLDKRNIKTKFIKDNLKKLLTHDNNL